MKMSKRMFFYALLFLLTMLLTSFSPQKKVCNDEGQVLMVLKTPDTNEERFSVFQVKQVDGVLVGTNIDEYTVGEGIYRIEAASDDKFYHKKIIILE